MAHILVIEDEPLVARFLAAVLQHLGQDARVATTAQEGLALIQSLPLDLVLCDLRLDGSEPLTGVDVLRLIRQDKPHLPVAILTGFGSVPTAVEAMRLGALDYVEKPVTTEAVKHLLSVGLSLGPHCLPGWPGLTPSGYLRWAEAVCSIARAPRDPRTVGNWARFVGVGTGTLYTWCAAVKVPARTSLLFGRLLRASFLAQTCGATFDQSFDIVDPRTRRRVLSLAGITSSTEFPRCVADLMKSQQTISQPEALLALTKVASRLW